MDLNILLFSQLLRFSVIPSGFHDSPLLRHHIVVCLRLIQQSRVKVRGILHKHRLQQCRHLIKCRSLTGLLIPTFHYQLESKRYCSITNCSMASLSLNKHCVVHFPVSLVFFSLVKESRYLTIGSLHPAVARTNISSSVSSLWV